LKHFGSGPNIDVLLGDLAEQHAQNGSAMWYWRQALKAIPVTFFREIRAHKAFTATALITGWVFWILAARLVSPFLFAGTGPADGPEISFSFDPGDPVGSAGFFMAMPSLAWTSFRPDVLSPAGGWTTSIAVSFAVVLPLVVGAISGALVARWRISAGINPPTVHVSRVPRDRQRAIILAFACSVLIVGLVPFVLTLRTTGIGNLNAFLGINAVASFAAILFGGGMFWNTSTQRG
jgi:hypothetical protein